MSNSLKRLGKSVLDRSIVPMLRYTIAQALPGSLDPTLYSLARRQAMETSLQYVDAKMADALMFKTRVRLWDYALSKISVTGTCAEFGVWKGESINYFAKRLSRIYGFDSFEGLREDWKGWDRPAGSFDLRGRLPQVVENVRLIKGWFNDTVPNFLVRCPEPFAFVHIDCDTFEATEVVLSLIGSHLTAGTVLVFDEYFGYRGWQCGEFKAWNNYVYRTNTEYEYLGFSSQQVALQIRSVR
jgi:hypothetical protein